MLALANEKLRKEVEVVNSNPKNGMSATKVPTYELLNKLLGGLNKSSQT